jgi:hypothetical protein
VTIGAAVARFLSGLFEVEEINGAERCPTYMYRWPILSTGWFKVYVHRIVADDWSRDLHDHPKRFVSIGLWGAYVEQTPAGERLFRAPWIRTFPATHIHRLRLTRRCGGCDARDDHPEEHTAGCYIPLMLPRECWTFVVVFRPVRSWGFWHAGQFIPWRRYVGSEVADRMKACQ